MSKDSDLFKKTLAQAKKEIREEKYREAVDLEKQRLREKRTVWERVFPYKISIKKRN